MKKYNFFILFFLPVAAIFSASTALAETPLGWRWYNDNETTVIEKKKEEKPINNSTLTRTMSSLEQLNWFKAQHEEIQAAATIDPTNNEKVEKAMLLNQFVSNESSKFGMTFKEVLLSNPDLSYVKDRPVEHAARGVHIENEKGKKIHAIKTMASEGWGFFFIYNGNDSLTQRLAPSIQQFATRYGIEVLGISKDGKTLDSIKNNKIDNKEKAVITPDYIPALLLVNPITKEMKPLAYGFISQDQLLGRFFNVATNYTESDF